MREMEEKKILRQLNIVRADKHIKFLAKDNLEYNVSNSSDRNDVINKSARDINNLCLTEHNNAQHKLKKSREVNPEKKNNMQWDTGLFLISWRLES